MIIDSPSAFKLREKPERGNESTEKSGKSWSVPRPNREIREQSLFLSSHKQTLSWLKTRRRLEMRFLRANSRRGPWRVLSAQSRGPQRPRQFEPLIDSLRRWGGREWREKTRVKERSEGGGVLVTLLILGKDRNLWCKGSFVWCCVAVCFWGADFWSFCVLL